MSDGKYGHELPDAPPHADYVGTPPGRLPEELGGEAALVGNREAEGGIPAEAEPFDPRPQDVPGDANLDYTSEGASSAAPAEVTPDVVEPVDTESEQT